MDSANTAYEGSFNRLHQAIDEGKLIAVAYGKSDMEHLEDDDGNPINLTDEEWEQVRHRFSKASDFIYESMNSLLDDIAREVASNRTGAKP